MNYEETLATLKAIQASYSPMPFLMDPDAEPRFVINSNERTIEIPEEFKFLAVKMDHMSERIYFEIPRYFDGEDLATKVCAIIRGNQYYNAARVIVQGWDGSSWIELGKSEECAGALEKALMQS